LDSTGNARTKRKFDEIAYTLGARESRMIHVHKLNWLMKPMLTILCARNMPAHQRAGHSLFEGRGQRFDRVRQIPSA
jgi:hypothetical protein